MHAASRLRHGGEVVACNDRREPHYPLDPLNFGMLQTDSDGSRVMLPRKERLDYMSAEHSRAINRVQRDRKKLKEDEAMSDLLNAVSSLPLSHTLPPLAASANRSRLPSSVEAAQPTRRDAPARRAADAAAAAVAGQNRASLTHAAAKMIPSGDKKRRTVRTSTGRWLPH